MDNLLQDEERKSSLKTAIEIFQKILVIYQAYPRLPNFIDVPDEVLDLLINSEKELDSLRSKYLISIDEIELAEGSLPPDEVKKAELLYGFLMARAFKSEEDAENLEPDGWEKVHVFEYVEYKPSLAGVQEALNQLYKAQNPKSGTYFCVAYIKFPDELCLMKRTVDANKLDEISPIAISIAERYRVPPDELVAVVFYSGRSFGEMTVFGSNARGFLDHAKKPHINKTLTFQPWSELKEVPKRGIIDVATAFKLKGKVLFIEGNPPSSVEFS